MYFTCYHSQKISVGVFPTGRTRIWMSLGDDTSEKHFVWEKIWNPIAIPCWSQGYEYESWLKQIQYDTTFDPYELFEAVKVDLKNTPSHGFTPPSRVMSEQWKTVTYKKCANFGKRIMRNKTITVQIASESSFNLDKKNLDIFQSRSNHDWKGFYMMNHSTLSEENMREKHTRRQSSSSFQWWEQKK